jgi:phosphoglycolate phosphatase
MQPRLVLFDCDGTLIDSASVIVNAMVSAFVRNGLPAPDAQEIRAIIGLSLPSATAVLASRHPEAPVSALVTAYKAAYRDSVVEESLHEPLFPGVAEALDRVEDERTLLGIVTGKSRAGLTRVLAAHGLSGRFIVTRTADDAASKPAPDMVLQSLDETGAEAARTVVIGDTSFDMAMARAAGVRAVGVSWGYHGVAELEAAGAETVVQAAADLPAIVNAILPLD